MNKKIALILTVLMMLICCACSSGSQLTGSWVVEGSEGAPWNFPDEVTFFSDKTCVVDGFSGEYSTQKGSLKLALLGSAYIYDYNVSKSTLVLSDDNYTVTYVRPGSAAKTESD